jgi:hypothetical protein
VIDSGSPAERRYYEEQERKEREAEVRRGGATSHKRRRVRRPVGGDRNPANSPETGVAEGSRDPYARGGCSRGNIRAIAVLDVSSGRFYTRVRARGLCFLGQPRPPSDTPSPTVSGEAPPESATPPAVPAFDSYRRQRPGSVPGRTAPPWQQGWRAAGTSLRRRVVTTCRRRSHYPQRWSFRSSCGSCAISSP